MREPTRLGAEQPVEDVLEQQREAEDRGADEEPTPEPPPEEADQADVADQHIEVPLEDDRYPRG